MYLRPIHLQRLTILCLCALMLLARSYAGLAFASSDPITITSQTDIVNFPSSIDFQMTAVDSVSPIIEADIYIEFSDGFSGQHTVSINNPAKMISVKWHEDISGSNSHPTGTKVQYYWTLQDSVNHKHADVPQVFTITGSSNADITVTSQADTVNFPKYIDFRMTAVDSNNAITQASIYVLINSNNSALEHTIEHTVIINKPAKVVTVDWHDDTSGSNFLTPGTPISYYWVVQDSANQTHTDVKQQFSTVDTRFSWQHLAQGKLQVNWYNRPQVFGQLVLNKATSDLAQISNTLGGGLLHPINLWVYETNVDFHGALAPNSYEWVGGEAHPALNEAFISATDANDDTLIRDMPHELTHLVFHQLTAQGLLAPTWFDEGLAVYNQLYHEPELTHRLGEAMASHTLLRLYNIADGFPADADKAYLAYAQSWNLIDYMYRTFGQAKMVLLIKDMNSPDADFGQDLTQALGVDQLHLENQWHLYLQQPPVLTPDQLTPTPRPVLPVSQTVSTTDNNAPVFIALGILLILVPLVGIMLLLISQRRRRQGILAVQSAQYILANSAPPRQQGSPMRYTAPGGPAQGPMGGPMPPPQTPPIPYIQGRAPGYAAQMPGYPSPAPSYPVPGYSAPTPAPGRAPSYPSPAPGRAPSYPQIRLDQGASTLASTFVPQPWMTTAEQAGAEQGKRRQAIPPRAPVAPAGAVPGYWQPDYPAIGEEEDEKSVGQEPAPFTQSREYLSQPLKKPAPQE